MSIKMIGVDYKTLNVSEREKYSFTNVHSSELGRKLCQIYGARGVVVISTCNRTEIWTDGFKGDLEQAFFDLREEDNPRIFTHRRSREAVHYLFELACGMHSQIFGEDQILTQVKNALFAAREEGLSSPTLETLFRLAITSAKSIKTNVVLTDKNASIPGSAVETVSKILGSLEGKKCLVIGNGEMGKLAASLLIQRGCEVTVTVRSYHRGAVIIPDRCRAVMYDERYDIIPKMDVIFSATLSPHYTVSAQILREKGHKDGAIFVDLALPRDIEEEVMSITTLLGIDNLEVKNERDEVVIGHANEIIKKHVAEFYSWCTKRDVAADAKIVGRVLGDMCRQKLGVNSECIDEELMNAITDAVQKSAEKLVFSAKQSMDETLFTDAVRQFRRTAEDLVV